MKIVLVGINAKYIHSNLAVRYLKAYTKAYIKDSNYQCEIKEFSINDRRERILEEIISAEADVVAFSTYIWNAEYVTTLSKLIKKVNPAIEILFGGPEVSYNSKEFLENNDGDYVIEGEGEETYKEFVQYKLGQRDIEEIKGFHYKKENQIFFGGERPLMNMDDIPFPYEAEEDVNNKIVYFESSRGCPFQCKYCLSSTLHKVRFLNIDRVKTDLKFLIDKKVRLIKFVDRTFNCNSKFAMAIWEFLINMDTDTCFHFEISADLLKEEEIALLAKAPKGRFQFEIGVQTTNPETLSHINRNVNFDDIKEKVEELQKIKNSKQHLDLIAGLPGENYESFKKSFNDVYSILPEEIQLGFLKLLKGSPMREEAEKWEMVYSPYPPYEILKTKDITYKELLQLKRVEEMVDKYYNSQKFNNILKYFVQQYPTPFDFYHSLGNYFYQKGYFSRNISSAEYYEVFLQFNKDILEGNNDILEDIIKYDYLSFNKKRGIPSFLQRKIEKEEERKIKEELKEKDGTMSLSAIYVEKFSIDMAKFIKENKIEKGNFYLGFYFDKNETIITI